MIGILNQVGFIFLWQRLVDSFSLVVEEIGNEVQIFARKEIKWERIERMTRGTPEVRSDKSLTLMTFNIQHSTNGPMDQRTN